MAEQQEEVVLDEDEKQLAESLKVQERVQEREKELKALRLAVETLKSSAQTAVKASEGVLNQLEQEIELRRRGVELERADDHIQISGEVSPVAVLLPPESMTREDLLKNACPLSLDLDTVSNTLSLSEENRKVTHTGNNQRYTDHPERFTYWRQVLCREGQSARCYWEVEWSGSWVQIAVCYKDIKRTGAESGFVNNNKSWCLLCYSGSFSAEYRFSHNNVQTTVSGPRSSRIGVYLDHKAGTLSFYSVVSDTVTLLHTVRTTFTQDLYPGIRVDYDDGAAAAAELMKIW